MSKQDAEQISEEQSVQNAARKAMETVCYLRKGFLYIAVDGIPHLRNHVCRLGRNLRRFSTAGIFAGGYVPDIPHNPSTSQRRDRIPSTCPC